MTTNKRELSEDIFEKAMQATMGQKASVSFSRTTDENYQVLPTFLDQSVILYFPTVNKTHDEATQKDKYAVLPSVRHGVKDGGFRVDHRCIRGVELAELDWDGECPLCEAGAKSWDLYNHLVAEEGLRQGVDPKDDPAKKLAPYKQQVGQQKEVNTAEAYVTGAVVHIITDDKGMPTGEVQPYILDFRLSRWNDNVIKALETAFGEDGTPLASPLGTFMNFNFIYDTKGKQAEARDAARNMTVSVIENANRLNILKPIVEVAEKAAEDFTLRQMGKVLKALEFKPKADVTELANRSIRKTEQTLAVIEQQKLLAEGGVQQGTAGYALPPVQDGQPALAAFSNPVATQVPAGVTPQAVPAGQVPQPSVAPVGQAPAAPVGQAPTAPLGQAPAAPVAPPTAPSAPPSAPSAPPVAPPTA